MDEFTGLPDMMSDGFLKCPVNMIVSNVLSGIWKSVVLTLTWKPQFWFLLKKKCQQFHSVLQSAL